MKTNKRSSIFTRLAALLMALVLFAGMATVPAYAANTSDDETSATEDEDDNIIKIEVKLKNGKTVTLAADNLGDIRSLIRRYGYTDEDIDAIFASYGYDVKNIKTLRVVDKNGELITFDATSIEEAREKVRELTGRDDLYVNAILQENGYTIEKPRIDPLARYKTSEDATVIKENHIGREWAEIDWSMASDGYITVIVNKLAGPNTTVDCSIWWYKDKASHSDGYTLKEGIWTIPLPGGSTEYAIQLGEVYSCCKHNMTEAEKANYESDERRTLLDVKFKAEVKNTEAKWLLSTPSVNYKNAPLACEKALDLTKNCKTDAEKITAVFNWVAKNIKYDYARAKEMDKAQAAAAANTNKEKSVSCLIDEKNGTHTKTPDPKETGYKNQNQLDLDIIMTKKTGICNHKATLMAGMLRSIGVPCKVVTGTMKGEGHAWVAVNPQTGKLDLAKLGAGKDYEPKLPGEDDNERPTGWIRLDPTNAHTPKETAKDANYSIKEAH